MNPEFTALTARSPSNRPRSSRGPFTMPRPASRSRAPWSPASSLPARKPASAVWCELRPMRWELSPRRAAQGERTQAGRLPAARPGLLHHAVSRGSRRPGLDPVHYDIALRSGVWITGKVADLKTGKPVPAAVDYFPFLSNPHAKDYRNFDPTSRRSNSSRAIRTDRDGRFRLVGLPGGGVVTAHADDKLYRAGVGAEAIVGRTEHGELLTFDRIVPAVYQGLKEVNVPEGAESFACDLGLDPGGSVRIRLVGYVWRCRSPAP